MQGSVRVVIIAAYVVLLTGCQDARDEAMLLGQRSGRLADAGQDSATRAEDDRREDAAHAAVTRQVNSTAPQSRPPARDAGPPPVSSMSAARLPVAAAPSPAPRDSAVPSAPVVEWVSAVPVQQSVLDEGPAVGMVANASTSAHAAPGTAAPSLGSILERAVKADPNDVSSQIRLRYLYMAEGRADRATTLPEGMDPRRAERLMTWMRAQADAEQLIGTGVVRPDASRRFDDLAATVRARSELEIARIELCSSIQSFGRYETVPDDFFVAGTHNRVYIYCELANFASLPVEAGYRAHVAHRLELLSLTGEVVWQDAEFLDVIDVCRNRRTDFFFNRYWQLPAQLPAGDYVLNVIVEDRLKSQRTEAKHELSIRLPGYAGS